MIVEALARAMELPGVRGAWIEIAGGRARGRDGSARDRDARAGAAADLGVELRAAGSVLGVLQLAGPDEELLDDEELRTLEAFGNQVGAALERALLQEHLERRVQERTAELSAEVAARRRAEEALRAMAAIVESADDGMVRLGPDGRIETWNRGARAALRLRRRRGGRATRSSSSSRPTRSRRCATSSAAWPGASPSRATRPCG